MKILVTKLESDKCGHHQTISVRSNDIVDVQFHNSLEFSPGDTPRLSHPGHHRPKGTVGSCVSVATLKGKPPPPSLLECLECQANLSSIFFRGSAQPLCLYYGSRFPR